MSHIVLPVQTHDGRCFKTLVTDPKYTLASNASEGLKIHHLAVPHNRRPFRLKHHARPLLTTELRLGCGVKDRTVCRRV